MSVLVPWPRPAHTPGPLTRGTIAKSYAKEPSALSLTEFLRASSGPLATSNVSQTLAAIQTDVEQLRPLKQQLIRTVEKALAQSPAQCLRDCLLELVGSTSWGGDVPQSDLDLVLFTREGCASGSQAIEVLKALRHSLENISWSFPWCPSVESQPDKGPSTLQQIELIETACVPILRIHCARDLHCDISVDQQRSVAHRDLLKQLLATLPLARDLVRLVKFWIRRRGLPAAAEGGLPSLAWAIIAIRFAQSKPKVRSIEDLFCSFFEEMQQLSSHSLRLRCRGEVQTPFLEWRPRGGSAKAWADEWIKLITVEDPCAERLNNASKFLQSTHHCSITSPSMPAALGLLYIVDFRLAWNAVCEGRWYDVWRCPAQAAPALDSLMVDCKMHVVLKDGQVSIGKMQDVTFCKGLLSGRVLNRRDQSSQLSLQVSKLRTGRPKTVYAKTCNKGSQVVCEPCHWVCGLPMGPRMLLLAEGLMRLAEVIQVVGITRVSPDLCDAVLSWRHACAASSPVEVRSDPPIASGNLVSQEKPDTEKGGEIIVPGIVMCDDSSAPCQSVSSGNPASQEKRSERKLPVTRVKIVPLPDRWVELPIDPVGDDSTRASVSDCDSQSTSGQVSELSEAICTSSDAVVHVSEKRAVTVVRQVPSVWRPTLWHKLQEFKSTENPLVTGTGLGSPVKLAGTDTSEKKVFQNGGRSWRARF